MSETTIRFRTQADLAALREYNRTLQEVRRSIVDLRATQSGAGAPQGANLPPSGIPQWVPPQLVPMAPIPPAPAAPAPGGAPGGRGSGGGGGGGGDGEPQGGGRPGMGFWGGMAQAGMVPSMAHHAYTLWKNEGWKATAGYLAGSAMTGTGSMLLNASNQMTQIGLGSSLTGFFLGSGEKYMELSRVITMIGRRFREAREESAAFWGSAMGYTIAQNAPMVEALGSLTNHVDPRQYLRILGFSRHFGLDPNTAIQSIGTAERFMGPMNSNRLAALVGRAGLQGMDEGKLPEFMQVFAQLAESQYRNTGRGNFDDILAELALPTRVFGMESPLGRGNMGADFLERFGNVVSGNTNPAMRTFMMRAMGYGSGKPGAPGYVEMRKRLDAGLSDPRNVVDLFSAFQDRKMGFGAQYRAIESVAGGTLKAHEIEALVKNVGSLEGLNSYIMAMGGTDQDKARYLGGLSAGDRAVFEAQGFAGLGARSISMGEGAAVQMEGLQMDVGKPVAQGILDVRQALINIAQEIKLLTDLDVGKLITDTTGAIKELTAVARDMAGKNPGILNPKTWRTREDTGNGITVRPFSLLDIYADPSMLWNDNIDFTAGHSFGSGGGQ